MIDTIQKSGGGNKNLHSSRVAKQDEFYTLFETVNEELKHYKKHFRNQVVFCNCDDPEHSNFYKYFKINFEHLGLKKLITTHYENDKPSYKLIITEYTEKDPPRETLLQNGDFRSDECIKLLNECDIVATNPPFSLMKEYLPLLISSGKKFIILGNLNHATWAETFPLLMEHKFWLGVNSGHFWFKVPDYYENKRTDFKIDENGQKYRRMGNCCWFTNIDIPQRHIPLTLYKKYTDEDYPKFDNFDAIECSKVQDIPEDTDKIIGVPLTYLAKHCDEQFEIIGKMQSDSGNDYDFGFPKINGKNKYVRILIRRKK